MLRKQKMDLIHVGHVKESHLVAILNKLLVDASPQQSPTYAQETDEQEEQFEKQIKIPLAHDEIHIAVASNLHHICFAKDTQAYMVRVQQADNKDVSGLIQLDAANAG